MLQTGDARHTVTYCYAIQARYFHTIVAVFSCAFAPYNQCHNIGNQAYSLVYRWTCRSVVCRRSG